MWIKILSSHNSSSWTSFCFIELVVLLSFQLEKVAESFTEYSIIYSSNYFLCHQTCLEQFVHYFLM